MSMRADNGQFATAGFPTPVPGCRPPPRRPADGDLHQGLHVRNALVRLRRRWQRRRPWRRVPGLPARHGTVHRSPPTAPIAGCASLPLFF